ncbi:MAG: hypothetical protein HXS48_02880 [Theionarchaea archaeon]|nr:MAG: hypothetical protein AYK19_18515 [Theionarchaea archaeon DG-70-1]MBU7025860.1 hypothetical protein [Theionarchaea archaeon]
MTENKKDLRQKIGVGVIFGIAFILFGALMGLGTHTGDYFICTGTLMIVAAVGLHFFVNIYRKE